MFNHILDQLGIPDGPITPKDLKQAAKALDQNMILLIIAAELNNIGEQLKSAYYCGFGQ